jgi:hypothetical protein
VSRPRIHPTVAFYGDTRGLGSFYRTNESLVRAFRKAGMKVQLYGRYDPLNKGDPADLAFIHPGWSAGDFVGLRGARKVYRRIVFMDVLNYAGIGPKARAVMESGFFDAVCLSAPNPEVARVGGRTQVIPWPQGVGRDFSPKQYPLHAARKRRWAPRILMEAFNPSLLRKGHDLHAKVLKRLREAGASFEAVVHAPYTSEVRRLFEPVGGVKLVPTYLDRTAQRRLWDACDILLHLNRGGGWELMPAEAAARGLIPVIPNAAPMTSYAADGAFFLVEAHPWRMSAEDRMRWDVGLDAGPGYEADVEGAVVALKEIIDGFPVFKAVSEVAAVPFYDQWSMDRVMAENLNRLFQTLQIRPETG